jgi:hypothetical protein
MTVTMASSTPRNHDDHADMTMKSGGSVSSSPPKGERSRRQRRQLLNVKDLEWDNLGRKGFVNNNNSDDCSSYNDDDDDPHNVAIEQNSAMLEDLLLLALLHDIDNNDDDRNINDNIIIRTTTNNNTDDNNNNNKQQYELSSQLKSQLQSYVTQISTQYHKVGFHSWEHASHVMLSATKLCYMLKDAASASAAAANTCDESVVVENNSVVEEGEQHNNSSEDNNVTNGGSLYDDPTTIQTRQQQQQQTPIITKNSIYDPWLHFGLTFAALLHDVDHKGLPNASLKTHSDPLSIRYGSPICMCSYAEWNSIDIGLSLLESDEFDLLRGVLLNAHQTQNNNNRGDDGNSSGNNGGGENFLRMVQDLVLCTDIASSQRRELGMSKWERIFDLGDSSSYDGGSSSNKRGFRESRRSSLDTVEASNTKSAKAKQIFAHGDEIDKKQSDDAAATSSLTLDDSKIHDRLQTPEAARAIAEQIMQAADVSHTMQHFDTFVKWNQSLYHEILAAYNRSQDENNDRNDDDKEQEQQQRHPAQNWYESQIGFFDGYVIPLAKRLDACGAFGTGGDGGGGGHFVPLAVRNKELWILRGRECTRIMVSAAEAIDLPPPMPLNVAEEDEGGEEVDEDGIARRPMPRSSFLQRRILGTNSLDEESSDDGDGNYDDDVVKGAIDDSIDDTTDISSVPGSVETSGRVTFVSTASSRASILSRNGSKKWGGEEKIDSSVNALVPNMLVRQMIDSLENDCDLAPRQQQMSAL